MLDVFFLIIVFPFFLVKFLAAVHQHLYQFFTIFVYTIKLFVVYIIIAVQHFYPIEGFAGFFESYEALALEVGFADGIGGLSVVGSDARTRPQ